MINPEFLKLKGQVESMNQSSGSSVTKMQREAHFWQMHLRSQNIGVEFSLLLSDLEPEFKDTPVGPHGHTRSLYQLKWSKRDKSWGLYLTNIKAGKTLPLIQCPDYLLEVIIPQMENFLSRLNAFLAQSASYDEDYAQDVDQAE